MKFTCLSLDCPERKSVCCGAISKAATYPERMLGVPEFFCSKCGKEYVGGDCNATNNLVDELVRVITAVKHSSHRWAKSELRERIKSITDQAIQEGYERGRIRCLEQHGLKELIDEAIEKRNEFWENVITDCAVNARQAERERILKVIEECGERYTDGHVGYALEALKEKIGEV